MFSVAYDRFVFPCTIVLQYQCMTVEELGQDDFHLVFEGFQVNH